MKQTCGQPEFMLMLGGAWLVVIGIALAGWCFKR